MTEPPRDLEQDPIVQKLRSWDPAVVEKTSEFRGELTLELSRAC